VSVLRRRRVPVVRQHAASECAAASLAMILRHHGREVTLEECRERCGFGRDGATALALAQAARSFGLRVRSYKAELEQLPQVDLPAVAFWNFKHFLVIERWSPEHVDVVDPAEGRRRLTAEEFDQGFTGMVLTFEPGTDFERKRSERPFEWRTYLRYLVRGRGIVASLLQILVASLLLQGIGLGLPVLTKVVIDDILPYRLADLMPILGLGILIWVAAQSVTSYLRSVLLIYVQSRLDAQVMLGFFEHVLSLPFRFFQQRTSGDLLMRLGSNAVLRELLTSQTLSIFLDGVLVLFYLVILLAWEPLFAVLAVGLGLAQIVILVLTHRRIYGLSQADLEAQADSQSYLVEALSGIGTLKASGAEDRALEHWSSLFFKELNVSMRRGHLTAVIETATSALGILSPLLLLWVGARLVLDGQLSLGSMLALNSLAASFLTPLGSLVASGQALQLVGAHLDRIADVLGSEPEQPDGGRRPSPPAAGRLELQHVSFRYDPAAPRVIEDVSLAIEPGEKLAIVGRTGSGKSTLGQLLLGLHRPTEGRVLYGGAPVEEYDLRRLRRRFGVVLQEPFLFSGSIRDNVALNDPSLPLERIREAARTACIADEIEAMPMGFETLLAEGGGGLSGGQRQRLALARALAHEPSLLLLDEATSHLDVVTERQVDENLSRLRCTRIVIAHRLSTVRNADRIAVLLGGQLVELGTHDELMAKLGFYEALVREQLRD